MDCNNQRRQEVLLTGVVLHLISMIVYGCRGKQIQIGSARRSASLRQLRARALRSLLAGRRHPIGRAFSRHPLGEIQRDARSARRPTGRDPPQEPGAGLLASLTAPVLPEGRPRFDFFDFRVSQMDRSWVNTRLFSKAHLDGVTEFMNIMSANLP